jgi:3-keto-5-aminohexanoate cleavage enzyme
MEDLIINFAPTGMIPTKEMTPYVPIEPSEIIEDVHQAWELGITMVHVHAREPGSGIPSSKAEIYGRIIKGIRKYAPDLIVCVSLSGRICAEIEKRAEPLELTGELAPDMGSLTLSSLNFNKSASINEPEMIKGLARILREKGIAPELEAFDAGMINFARYLEKNGLISPPYYFNLLLGNIACAQPDLLHAGVLVRDLPPLSLWSFAGIGDYQLRMNSLSIAMGGGVRVGLEDNIWYDGKRTKLARNIELLRRIHMIAEANERKLMSPNALRRRLNLAKGTDGKYGLKR